MAIAAYETADRGNSIGDTTGGDVRVNEGMDRLATIRLRLVDDADDTPAAEHLSNALHQVDRAIDALAALEPAAFDPAETRQWLAGIERSRRMIEAASVSAADHIDRSNPFRGQGFFSAKTVLQHMLQLSGPEAYRRLQTARMQRRLPNWADAERAGEVGVAQSELMARVAANPRVSGAALQLDQQRLLDDAIRLSFDDFDRNVRMWEALADPDGDRTRNERQAARRDFNLRPNPGFGWTLSGALPEPGGVEFMAIFAYFAEAEWQADWAEARDRLGADATATDLRRTDAQRRADAVLTMARTAASKPPGSKRPTATVNILIDRTTMEAHLRGERQDPSRYRDVVCRTQSGRRLHPDDVVNTALVDHVRRVVYDGAGTIIDLGRRSRLFRGSARDAVMLLFTECVWTGCDRPVDWCDADHSRGWRAHGATVPRNGAPLCGAHNNLKEHGFEVFRDAVGDWHVLGPDGGEIT